LDISENRDGKLVVTGVDPGGNAAKAGVQRGDIIVAAGGLNDIALKDYQEITNVLNAGDQLEFKISRNGSEKELMVQYGTAPTALDAEESSAEAPAENGTQSRTSAPQFDFAPAPSSDAMQSVLLNSPQAAGSGSRLTDSTPIPNYSRQEMSSGNPAGQDVAKLIKTVKEQQQIIARMQQEILRLKSQSNLPARTNQRYSSPPARRGSK
jgi:hypothetical protein